MIKPLIIGHRGAAAEAPENTLASVERAISLGVDYVEVDVRLSRDGVPFLFHDLTTCRTAVHAKRHNLSDLDAATIRGLDAGEWFGEEYVGHTVPTLEELLRIERGRTGLMIEIKEEMADPRTIAKAVYSAVEGRERKEREGALIIGSFSPTILAEIQRLTRELPLIGLMEFASEIKRFKSLGINYLGINADNITPEVIEIKHREGVSIWTYTVDDPAMAIELRNMGVDGIITNNPRKIASCFDSQPAKYQ